MIQHKRSGFTVVELIIVIVVVALLATITTIAYRSTQASARDEKRKADATMLRGALEEYYSQYGAYPAPSCPTDPGSWASECWNNQAWQILKDEGFITKIPKPGIVSSNSSENMNSDGTTNYAWFLFNDSSYMVKVQMESGDCKFGKNVQSWAFGGVPECAF